VLRGRGVSAAGESLLRRRWFPREPAGVKALHGPLIPRADPTGKASQPTTLRYDEYGKYWPTVLVQDNHWHRR
jgi:hypothetical protein